MASPVSFARQPLYLQLRDLLAQRIGDRVWKPGNCLPNEQDLAREFTVSPGTVRKALDALEAEGLLIRRQGRGTFVTDRASGEMLLRFSNIRTQGGEQIASETELLEQTTGAANDIEQERLQLGSHEPVLRTRRVRRHQGHPFMYEEACLAISRFAGREMSEVGDYNISALAQEYGAHLVRASEKVSLAEASPEIAKWLVTEPGKLLLKLDRVIFAMDGRSVEWRIGFSRLKGEFYLAEMR
jgi:GntR family transcriptional regulator